MGGPRKASHESDFKGIPKNVFFTGTTALKKGQGLCYDRDSGTLTSDDAARTNNVELPGTTNHRWFAGVSADAHVANSAGQWIKIYVPGSVCPVLAGSDTVAPTAIVAGTVLHCNVATGARGLFVNPGYTGLIGRGAVVALTTQTNVIASSFDNTASVASTTLTDTGALTNVATGDVVYIVAGDGATVTPQELTATAIDANTLTLSAAPGNGQVCYIIVRNDPVVMARLIDADVEAGILVSGCCELFSTSDNTAAEHMIGGTTFVCPTDLTNGNCTATLGDGVLPGERKMYIGLGVPTSSDYVVTVTSGLQEDRSTQLQTVAFDAAAESISLEWWFTEWITDFHVGCALT